VSEEVLLFRQLNALSIKAKKKLSLNENISRSLYIRSVGPLMITKADAKPASPIANGLFQQILSIIYIIAIFVKKHL